METRDTVTKRDPLESKVEALLSQVPGLTGSVTLESLQAIHEQERQQACAAMDEMAKQFAREDAKRKKLWGNKYPRVLGQKPAESPKPVNPVKRKTVKGRK